MASQLKQQLVASLNPSGFVPLDKRVLVLPDPVEEKIGSIIKPDSVREQDEWAQTRGTLIAVGETAWSEAVQDARRNGVGLVPPQPGDRVLYAKYTGAKYTGNDGRNYMLMNDEDIVGRMTEEQ